jgi:plastocyanin
MHQREARFAPPFLAIAAGQSVAMENDDAIYHNVFSFSKSNDFDLGLYPAGESRTVTFRYAGVVRTYCSILRIDEWDHLRVPVTLLHAGREVR